MVQDESAENERQQDGELVEKHVAQLTEHFDSVVIICTRRGTSSTRAVKRYGGNYYAAYGSAKEWLVEEDEKSRENARG